MIHTHTFEVGGKTLSLETGRVAKQAGGAVLLGMGDTVVFCSATMSRTAREGIDFLPLMCDFEERKYAIGKIPGGFMKRGGRPSDRGVLASRLIDRPLRPLFPKGMRNDIQVIAMPLSVDTNVPPDVLSITAAGAALTISDIPFAGPVAGVRVGHINGEFVLFPSFEDLKESKIDLAVAGHKGAISMVEAGAEIVSEDLMVEGLIFAHNAIKVICEEIEKFAKGCAKEKAEPILSKPSEDLAKAIAKADAKMIEDNIFDPDKATRESASEDLAKELIAKYKEKYADDPEVLPTVAAAVDKAIKDTLRSNVINKGKRPDGRGTKDLRKLEATAGLLPRVHGSGLFTRGQTQVLTLCTLGMPGDAQKTDTLDESETERKYMHFYNFPPYSVGEVRPLRGAGRREVGHGALAERALRPVVPIDGEDFPYTVLLVSEVLESNGSTSMASVCGSTLAMLDAGVPLKAPVAGIAMGLMSDGKKFQVLTDIQGVEDFSGDMDFKVAGTREGITALQLDTKLDGIPTQVLKDALAQARDARLAILDVMEAEINAPRTTGLRAPRLTSIMIEPAKIGALIGPGGANIRKITEATGAQIDVAQDGKVTIGTDNQESLDQAINMIKGSTSALEVGLEFSGAVTRVIGRGAFVEMPNGRDGMVPTEKLMDGLRRPDQAVNIGEKINVRVDEVDAMGRVNLTALGMNPDHPRLSGNEPLLEPTGDLGGGGRDRDRGGRGGRDGGRDRGGRGGYGDRDRDRGGRGGYGDRDRGGRDRDRDRDRDRGGRGLESEGGSENEESRGSRFSDESAPDVPSAFPGRKRSGGSDDEMNARFRPRR
ncbi:MAG: polyribonucleotide nucleotidyltransferase [Fimbriimonadaceae bacterium]|nr:polyribonucleotide nucleotidyltransferase [Fimbriimonadaceae bacterium]